MNRLIKVGTLNGTNVYVDPKNVAAVFLNYEKDSTMIGMVSGELLRVIENVDYVASAINNA